MEPLLFLAHRIPYPPNKGDKIRSFHLLKYLGQRYRLHLGAFVDDPEDWRHARTLENMCFDTCLVGINARVRKLLSMAALLTGQALSLVYFRSRKMKRWVNDTLNREEIKRAVFFSSSMAQYALGSRAGVLYRVVDFVDVDSEKWRQYGARHRWPMSWLYRREGAALLRFERKVAAECEASVFVTQTEADLFRRLVPDVADKISWVSNGVDSEFFSPNRTYENPYSSGTKVQVFTGAMDYWANVDAVCWFAWEVFPIIHRRVPESRFVIVGAQPAEAVRRLAEVSGVQVTGGVPDIRPYLAHAWSAVAPLRIGRGIQNKVLEAMAMARPVLATPAAVEGLHLSEDLERFVSEVPEVLAERGVELLNTDREQLYRLGARSREHVIDHYEWTVHLRSFESLLMNEGRSRHPASRERSKLYTR